MQPSQHQPLPVFLQRGGAILLVLTLILSGCGLFQQGPPQTTGNSVPAFTHIFTIILENKAYENVIGNKHAPYFNSLVKTYALATKYYAISHPSLPNYIALTGGSTFGISNDCTACFQQASNLADQIEASGHTWKAYMESMPAPCYVGDSPNGLYRQKHNPFLYYDDIRTNSSRCSSHDVPFTQLATDLANKHLPDYVWISPNMCHDMHICTLAVGDTWLSQVVPTILNSTAFTQGGVLFITFDEGKTNDGWCNDAAGGQIATLVISPLVKKGWQSTTPETHYSLLRTVEDAWKLPPLGEAAKSTAMTEFFS